MRDSAALEPLRIMRVLDVQEGAGEYGEEVVRLDWLADGQAPVPAWHNLAVEFRPGDMVLVAICDQTPVVVCKIGGQPAWS